MLKILLFNLYYFLIPGFFGAAVLGALLVPMYYIPANKPFTNDPGHLENVWEAFNQMHNNWHIILATVGKS